MSKRRGLFVKGNKGRKRLGREFLRSPKEFAKRHGLDPEDLSCPPEAHEAFARGQAFADAAEKLSPRPDDESMVELRALADEHFGKDVEVALVPFGLRFRERPLNLTLDITGTASGTVTFLDTDAGVDS